MAWKSGPGSQPSGKYELALQAEREKKAELAKTQKDTVISKNKTHLRNHN